MIDRGTYRSIHTAIIDDPDFQDLPPMAKLLFYTCKMQLGASGIGIVYETTLAAQTGCHADTIGDAMAILCQRGWVLRERHVVWIRNGLKYDPSVTVENDNHRKSIMSHLRGLPKLTIINTYADYYGLEKPFPDMPSPIPCGMPSPIPCGGDTLSGTRDKGQGKGTRDKGILESCSEPSSDPQPVIALPLVGKAKTEYEITQSQIEEWKHLYPGADILTELKKCKAWNIANPTRRKTRAGILRHINSWLSRAQDKAKGTTNGRTDTGRRNYCPDDAADRKLAEALGLESAEQTTMDPGAGESVSGGERVEGG